MSLSPEQERALSELMVQVTVARERPAIASPQANGAGFLQTWLGLSEQEVQGKLLALLNQKQKLEGRFLDWFEGNPLDSAFLFLGAASAAFYAAEKDANPKIKTYIDAFYYIATCASVGYADIFAATQTGRAIAALVMIVGPSLAARTLDRPAA
ncbi:MAG: ion channel [Chloroflexi bacterium]|nr:ion channel [Chloroflexota bacterium]MCI0574871.1 ion channel [Chloroflexota bacterium]MCI0650099.1 ion channel [Chloroflexota bacterium]MCI0731183.1 ion channel [Chloroflexota bacterium]